VKSDPLFKQLPKNNKKSVAIVAMGPTLHDYLAACGSHGYTNRFTDEVWATNDAGFWLHTVDLIMAMDDFNENLETWPHWIDLLCGRDVPVVTSCPMNLTTGEQFKNAVAFPLDEVEKDIPKIGNKRPPYDNTSNFALALAIHRRFSWIGIFGMDNMLPSYDWVDGDPAKWRQYHTKKKRVPSEPCDIFMAYLIGIAQARGIQIFIPDGSTLCDFDRPPYYYGYENQPNYNEHKPDNRRRRPYMKKFFKKPKVPVRET